MFVKPGPDPHNPGQLLIVRHLITRRELPPEGEEVPDDMYWRRRLAHGDVVAAEPVKPEAALEEAREKVRALEALGEQPTEGPAA